MYTEQQREEKRKALLEKCFELFVQKGLENTSLNDLAKYCNTHKATFYSYFASKDEIVFECAKAYMENLGEKLFSGMRHTEQDVRSAMLYGFNVFADERNKIRYVYQVVSSPKYGEYSRTALAEIYRSYLSFSDVLAEHYSLDKEEFRACYLLFVATIHDYCLWGETEFIKLKVEYILSQIDKMVAK